MYIEDGKGLNGKAAVDSNQKLEVASEAASTLYHKSKKGASVYVQYAKRNFGVADSNENIFHMEYTGSGTLCVSKAVCASNAEACKIEFYKSPVYTSGGDLRSAINLNFGSAIPASTIAYISDTSEVQMTVDSDLELMDVRLSSTGDTTETVDFEGAIRLRKGDTFGAFGEVTSVAANERVRISLYFWEE